MSKRFGRNQKRRMREEIAKQEARANSAEGILSWHSNKREEYKLSYESLLRDIGRVYKNSVCIPPKTIKSNDSHLRDTYQIEILNPLSMEQQYIHYDGNTAPQTIQFKRGIVSRLQWYLTETFDENGEGIQIHLKIQGIAELGYYISKDALMRHGLPIRYLMESFQNEWYKKFSNKEDVRNAIAYGL